MKQFVYKTIDSTGKIGTGLVESLNEKQAAKLLQERGYVVVSLGEKKDWLLTVRSFFKFKEQVSAQEVATFTRLLSTMLETGLPLVEALSNLVFELGEDHFREVIRSVQTEVESGVSLSEAMGRYPDIFNNLYVNLVKAGEASGKVGETLGKLADTLEAELEFRAKVKGALVYPMIVVVAMGGIGVFMMTTIIPQISQVYMDFRAELPLPTKIMIGLSTIIRDYTLFVLVILVFLFITYRIFRNNPTSDYLINNILYKFPVMGELNREVVLAILNRTLGTLLGSGVSIIDALKIVAATMANDYFRSGIERAAGAVEKGLPLSVAIRRDSSFPTMMAQLVAIGEETGTVDRSLLKLADFFQGGAERRVKVLTTAMEPLLILLMGLAVGGMAIAVLLPMFNLVNVIK